ncbi:transmembrane protein, putative [Bodo saltans]|uniref:Transmembrane protein, putative n=1 Tax=Bodo saltans TaxID=75058 RepID=A0A0S4IP75_BODSA|nr:transmembrane protein, putative [Bodo saltans]|eukprot:CUF81166.1 transmembrane protein, putative [Bodo saltans]
MPPVHNPLGEHGGIPKDFAMPPRAHYDGAKMKGSKPTADVTTSTDSFMGTGSFTALLITLTMTTVGVMIWLAYRFMKQRQRQQLKSGKSVTKKSIAQQVLNAMMRAKGVAVWLKAIRYVQNGITDDRLFKNNATAVANAHQHNNPFIQDDKDDEEDTVVGGGGAHGGAGKETNLAIIICTDEPTTTTTNNNPSASTQIDAERLTQMFDHLAYFGGSYKTVTFSSKSIAPTSANIAEILVQLAASRRVWNQVVVFISAPTRAFPKDFLDSSVFRNPNSDLSTVEKFSRPVKQPKQSQGGEDADDGEAPSSASSASTFVGSAGLEFLAQPEKPEDPLSWIDVALLLDRLRLVTKRRDDDAPILLLFDPVMPTGPSAAGHGVSDSVAWMHVDKFQVEFNESPAEAQQRGAKPDDEKLTISSEEMVKFLPDEDLLKELSGMPLDVLLRNALGIYESLTATVVCAENQPPRVASVKSAAASGKKKQSVASAFCEAILDGQKGQSLSIMGGGGGWAGAAQQGPSMGGGDAFEALLTSAPFQSGAPNNASVSEAILRTSSSSLEDTIATSLYDTGMMTSETVALHLAHYHQYHHRAVANDSASPPPPPRTFVVHTCGKGATVPPSLQPVPLATRVAMMPRPLHCRVPHTMSQLAQFLYSQVQADVNRLWLTMGGDDNNGVTSPASGSKLVTVFVRENGGSACSGSTLLGKRLAWDARLLQRYTSGVVYVDLRDLFAPAAFLSTSSSVTDLHKQWFIDLIGYICRLVGITVQIATMEEAQDVWERVWCHSEAQYFIIFDHAPVSLACGGNSEGSLHLQSLIQVLTRVTDDAVVKSRVLIIPEGDVSSISLSKKVSSLDGPRRGNAPSDENSKAAWLGNVTESLMGRSGVHLRSETWSAIRPLVVSLVESTISKGASSLDVLAIAEYFVKRAAASHNNVLQQRRRGGDQAVVLDASSMWTMLGDVGQAELVANVEQLLFDGSTRMPILIAPATDAPVASKKAKSSNSSGAAAIVGVNAPESVVQLDRLFTLQSIVLAPLLFRHQDHPQRIALHRARLIAVMFGRLTTYRFTVALQELVRLGIVLAENSSFVSDATSQSTLLEDAHAAMVDAGIMVRVNQLLVESAAALRRTDLHKLTYVTSLHSFTELLSSASQSSASVDESQLLFAVQASLISSMMPFVHPSRRSETRNHGVYLELVSLLSTLKENSTVVKGLTPEQVIGISETVKNKMCSPWFLQSVLEQCSAARLLMLLQGTEESLKALATIWHHHVARASNDSNPVPGVDVTVIASAVSTIRKIISVMELQLDV